MDKPAILRKILIFSIKHYRLVDLTSTHFVLGDCEYPMEYSGCFAHCQPTCQTPEPYCVMACYSGCVCGYGLKRDEDSGECVVC